MYTPVWRLLGLTGSEHGHLELNNGRLIYTPNDGTSGFDVPLIEIRDINFPWHYFSGGFKMRIGSENYRFSFVEPHNDHADLRGGRETGKAWRKALTGRQ